MTSTIVKSAQLSLFRLVIVRAIARWWQGAMHVAWGILAVVATVVVVGCTAGDFIYLDAATRVGTIVVMLSVTIALAERGWVRAALVGEGVALSSATAFTVPALTSMIAAMGVPYQDQALLAFDRALGFDWPAIIEWFGARPDLSVALSHVYVSLLWQPALLLPILAVFNPERLRAVLVASTLALVVTVAIFTFMPAQTGYVYLGYQQQQFPGMLSNTAWGVADIIEALRAGDRHLSIEGLITFPSFHAVAAALFCYAWSAVPILRWPFVVLNLVMIVSCVPIGSHYVVDVIGGVVLAIVALAFVQRNPGRFMSSTKYIPWRAMPETQILAAYCSSFAGKSR